MEDAQWPLTAPRLPLARVSADVKPIGHSRHLRIRHTKRKHVVAHKLGGAKYHVCKLLLSQLPVISLANGSAFLGFALPTHPAFLLLST
jgi:hypothetical protein